VKSKSIFVVLVVAVLGLQGLGCGGSSDEIATVSKTDFAAGGNQICSETVETQAATYEQIVDEAEKTAVTAADGKEAEAKLASVVASSVEDMVDEFEELGTLAGKEAEVAEMLELYEQGAEKTRADPQAFLKAEAFIDADKRAARLGLEKCEGI
jgi:hypothetical protein